MHGLPRVPLWCHEGNNRRAHYRLRRWIYGDYCHADILPAPTGAGAATASVTAAVGREDPTPAVYQEMELRVPLLSMLPIPYLRVEEFSLDFNVKINSMETYNVSDQLELGGSLEVQQKWGSGSAKLNISASYKRSTSAGTSVERTYDMAVHVRAVQDEMPGGLETILGILEQAVVSTPVLPSS
ncbi:MAG: DUF2589 domain-containing protein [Lewinellaceae bacterium]|nr:DUF2589 domain-containing protein [Lewinellaceae bacterium]